MHAEAWMLQRSGEMDRVCSSEVGQGPRRTSIAMHGCSAQPGVRDVALTAMGLRRKQGAPSIAVAPRLPRWCTQTALASA
jgi:hypothetical protein